MEDFEFTSNEDVDSMIDTILRFTLRGSRIFIPISTVMQLKAMGVILELTMMMMMMMMNEGLKQL